MKLGYSNPTYSGNEGVLKTSQNTTDWVQVTINDFLPTGDYTLNGNFIGLNVENKSNTNVLHLFKGAKAPTAGVTDSKEIPAGLKLAVEAGENIPALSYKKTASSDTFIIYAYFGSLT